MSEEIKPTTTQNEAVAQQQACSPVGWHAEYLKASDRAMRLEIERNEARRLAKQACSLLAENNFEVNYPPMPWEEGSPEND